MHFFLALINFSLLERKKQNGYWDRIENRKRFFIDIASEFNFDPYNLENWTQKVSYTQIAHKKVRLLFI